MNNTALLYSLVAICLCPGCIAEIGPGGLEVPDASRSTVPDASSSIDVPDASQPFEVDGGCVPKTCSTLGKTCGVVSDGCGQIIDCGPCSTDACTPTTCASVMKNCGQMPDGCGGNLTCGSCSAPKSCIANVCTEVAFPPISIIAVGDIANSGTADTETANLVKALIVSDNVKEVLTLGDHAYPSGRAGDFAAFYAPTYGVPAIFNITRPAPGNHDYGVAGAADYFKYFGSKAGPAGKGYYAFDIGPWRAYSLNSNVSVTSGSAQFTWLSTDLNTHATRKCVLAFWHHPRFQNGSYHGDSSAMTAAWNLLYDKGADLVMTGHEHNFQQLAPMNKTGQADANGLRSFVVGTGGASFYGSFGNTHPMEYKTSADHGVLLLTLRDTSYSWKFINTAGAVKTSGSENCR